MFNAVAVILVATYFVKILRDAWIKGEIFRLGRIYRRATDPFNYWLVFGMGMIVAGGLYWVGFGWMHDWIREIENR